MSIYEFLYLATEDGAKVTIYNLATDEADTLMISEAMEKTKMSALKDFKVLDEKIDNHGLKMRVVSFNVQNMKEDLLFYNCFCPTTKREYYLGTSEKTCEEAKAQQFGFKANDIKFLKEW